MTPRYQVALERLRDEFPAPWRDETDDEHLVASLADLIRRAQRLKGQSPVLSGRPTPTDLDHLADAALAEHSRTLDEVGEELVGCLRGLPLEVHPRNQVNVNAQPTIASMAGVVLPTLFNPNLTSEGRGVGCSEAELRVIAMLARLVGYDPRRAGGVFTFGGTGTMLYGVKLGLETACPDTMHRGLADRPVVLASQRSHHTVLTAAGWLGIGHDHVRLVPAGEDNAMDLTACADMARQVLREGRPIAALVATVGTTDAFGIDDVAALHRLREELVAEFQLPYRPHLHADAVIGWAWTALGGYDFDANPLDFPPSTLTAFAETFQRIAGLAHADSLGVDFHKTGFAPYVSSLLMTRDHDLLKRLVRDRQTMPYLFHAGRHHPGMFTLETTRSASGVLAALASLTLLGIEGLRVLLGNAVSLSLRLRERIAQTPGLLVLNPLNLGPVTLYRAYRDGVDPAAAWQRERHDPDWVDQRRQTNDWNRRIHQLTQSWARAGQGSGTGWTERYLRADDGQPIAALKSYLLSPFLDERHVDELIAAVSAARRTCPFTPAE